MGDCECGGRDERERVCVDLCVIEKRVCERKSALQCEGSAPLASADSLTHPEPQERPSCPLSSLSPSKTDI